MSTLRYAMIIGALFAVLLSAFHVDHQRVCAEDDGLCAADRDWHALPITRLLIELRERPRAEAVTRAIGEPLATVPAPAPTGAVPSQKCEGCRS